MRATKSRLTITLLSAALVSILAFARPADRQDPALRFQEAIDRMETKEDYAGAIQIFEALVKVPDRSLAARALYYLGFCHEKLGNDRAKQAYEQLIREFADQDKLVAMARSRLAAMQQAETGGDSGGLILRIVWKTQFNDPLGNPSPDGRYILCYVGDGDIGLHDLTNGQTRPPTKGASCDLPYAMSPVFSPSGGQVAYAWYNKDGSADLWLINLDGSGNRMIRKSEYGCALLPDDWSKDGKQILVYSVRFGKTSEIRPEIVAVSPENGQMKTIKQGGQLGNAQFSPDGKYIVFENVKDGDRNIYLMSSSGGMEIPLVSDPGEDFLLGWAPNRESILFSSIRRGGWEIWAVPVKDGRPNGTPAFIKEDVGRIGPLGFAQDGSYYFKKGGWEYDIYEAGIDLAKRELVRSQKPAVYQHMGNN